MSFVTFPLNTAHILPRSSNPLPPIRSTPTSGPPKQSDLNREFEMYSGASTSETSALEDEGEPQILHEPWDMPENVGPNHCAPGCSILIHAEEDSRAPRKFSFMTRRRSSRSSFSKSGGRPVVESPGLGSNSGHSGGGVAGLFHDLNPFGTSTNSTSHSAAATPAASHPIGDIKEDAAGPTYQPQGHRDSVASDMSSAPDSPHPGMRRRQSSLRFGVLPHRPPEMRRESSVALGVASRKALLTEQNGAGPPLRARNSLSGPTGSPRKGSAGNIMKTPEFMAYQRQSRNSVSSEPESVDIGESVTSGMKSLWRSMRGSISSNASPPVSPTSGSSQLPPSPVRHLSPQHSASPSDRRASAPTFVSPFAQKHPKPGPSPLHSPITQRGDPFDTAPTHLSGLHAATLPLNETADLHAVKEEKETASGSATPVHRSGGFLAMEKITNKLGPAEAPPETVPVSNGSGPRDARPELSIAVPSDTVSPSSQSTMPISPGTAAPSPHVTLLEPTPSEKANSNSGNADQTLKHPDPRRDNPSPPPREADRQVYPVESSNSEATTAGPSDSSEASGPPYIKEVASTRTDVDSPSSVSSEVDKFFETEVKWTPGSPIEPLEALVTAKP